MQRISSRSTFFYKRIFPAIWFGIAALVAVPALLAENGPGPVAAIGPVLMAIFGFLIMRKLIFDLVDEVWDAGTELLIRKKGREFRVPLIEIINISYSPTNPQRATLSLRQPSMLGREISFVPPTSWVPFTRSPVIDDLIERVDQARLAAARLR
jgi:hypothetical protein